MASEEHLSQEAPGISINVAFEQQSFRLIELPSPLLEIVESQMPSTLQLKSEAPRTDSTDPARSAFLCSKDKTFEVRQVHSSNILYVLQSSHVASESQFRSVEPTGVTAIAQCKSMLELVSSSSRENDFVAETVPLYEGPESLTQLPGRMSRADLLADAPCSESEFNRATNETCAFEIDNVMWLPTATSLSRLWKSFMSALTIKGLDILQSFSVEEVRTLVEEDGHDVAFLRSVMRRLESAEQESITDWCKIDQKLCVPWLGRVLLESHGLSGVGRSDLIGQWQDNLPEMWRGEAMIDHLDGVYRENTNGKIVSKSPLLVRQAAMVSGSTTAAAKPASKWHEKFKTTRK